MYLKILKKFVALCFAGIVLLLGGCMDKGDKETSGSVINTDNIIQETILETFITEQKEDRKSLAETITGTEIILEESSLLYEEQTNDLIHNKGSVHMVAIDAGHQQYGNSEQEPIGPGATQTKAKVAGGTSGVETGIPEYQLTLSVAVKLKEELVSRGYQVYMIRERHEVDISNKERAEAALNAGADILVRIHANGSENSSVCGAMTICMTDSNPYNAYLYDASKRLSENVLNQLVAATGANKQKIWETDTMSGINWCRIPVTIVEMGYMSNPDEDRLMADEDYQWKIAKGIADGIDLY